MDLVNTEGKRDALARLADLEQREAALFAERAVALTAISDLWSGQHDPARPLLALDVAVTCQVAQVTATLRMVQARRLVDELPQTLRGLQEKRLVVGQALVLLKETEGLRPALVRLLDSEVQDRIFGLTAGDTRREVKATLVRLDAEASQVRRREQQAQRRVWASERPDGRAFLGAELSAEETGTCLRALTELTGAVLDPADERTADQKRADLFSQLPEFALSHLPAFGAFLRERGLPGVREEIPQGSAEVVRARHARVQAVVLVPVETALDLSDNPGDLIGYGPVSGIHARELLALAEVRKACVDAHTGRMLTLERPATPSMGLSGTLAEMVSIPSVLQDQTEPRHDPSHSLTDLIRLRDPRCTGPGCAAPARTCDLDHVIPWPLGDTSADNLGPLSRRCHRAKTFGGWQVQPAPHGIVTWTSPLGITWTSAARHRPPDLAAFQAPRRVWPFMLIEFDGFPHAA